jgi:exodeoxyribonuclease-3
MPLLQKLVALTDPDIICLQETKVPDAFFPLLAIHGLGFPHVHFRGEKGYNGVAILSKHPFTPLDWLNHGGKSDTRHIAIRLEIGGQTVEIHNCYIPAGGDVPDPELNTKFAHKLQYLNELIAWSRALAVAKSAAIIVGDFNVAPLEHDVWSHKQLLKVVSHTPVEVALLTELYQSAGWIDAHRHFVPATEKLYSWWSYRNHDWRLSNRGRRLDHIWLTPQLLPHLARASILQDARDWPQTSDHVPIIADFV